MNQDRRGSATQTQLVCQRKLSVSWARQGKARQKEISFEQNEAIKIYLKKYAKKDEEVVEPKRERRERDEGELNAADLSGICS